MNVTSVKIYSEDNQVDFYIAVIDGIELCVPNNSDNRHYQAIQEWLAEGNTPNPAES